MPEHSFDWNSAWKMFVAGKSIEAIATIHGVTADAIRYGIFADTRKRSAESKRRSRAAHMTGSCYDCGTEIMDTSTRCSSCHGRLLAASR